MNQKKQKNTILITTFIISFLLTIICLISGGFSPFGSKNIISAGNHDNFLPYFYEYYDHFHSNSHFFFDKTYGLGQDFLSFSTYYFSDPSNFLLLLFPRTMLITGINLLFLLKISASSLCCAYFLLYKKYINNLKYTDLSTDVPAKIETDHKTDKETDSDNKKAKKKDFVIDFKNPPTSPLRKFIEETDWTIVAFSIAYSFANTMIVIGSNITYLSSIAIFPLVIMGVDKLIVEKKMNLFIITFSISILCNLHISIISLIFILLYYLTREYDSFKTFINRSTRLLISFIISLFTSGFVIINAFNGEHIKRELSLNFPICSSSNIFNSINQFATRTPISYYSFYGNHTDIAMGVGLLTFIFMYLFCKDIPFSERIKNVFLFFLIFSGAFLTTSKYLFNGFSFSAENYIHFGYCLTFLAIMISYDFITRYKNTSVKRTFFSILLLITFFISGMLLSELYENMNIFIITFEFIFGYSILLLIYSSNSLTKPLLIIFSSLLILGECLPSYYSNMKTIGTGYFSRALSQTNSYQMYEMARQIQANEPNATIMYYQSETDNLNPISYLYSGYDYIITQAPIYDQNNVLENVTENYINNSSVSIYIYKTKFNTIGSIYDNTIHSYKYNERYPFISSNIFTEDYLHDKSVFYEIDMNINAMESSDQEYANFLVTPYYSGDLYVSTFHTTNLGIVESESEYSTIQKIPAFKYLTIGYNYQAAIFDNESLINILNSRPILNSDIDGSLLDNTQVTIQSDTDGYISTGLPDLKTFSFYVNGTKVSPINFFDNNALIPITKGENTIAIKYNPIYLILGLLSSLLGVILIICCIKFDQSNRNEL